MLQPVQRKIQRADVCMGGENGNEFVGRFTNGSLHGKGGGMEIRCIFTGKIHLPQYLRLTVPELQSSTVTGAARCRPL